MHLQNESNKINKTIETTLKNLGSLIDVNTVIGKPLKTDDGECIIPISKVTVGILSGGGEYGKVTVFNKSSDLPFSAGNGAIISVKPCGFLVKNGKKYTMISVSDSPYEKLIDKASEFMSKMNIGDNND
ncbi:MAG: sporulation protein YtfJ [Clostridiales bacterium]|nr:sporulation protein YtfJ [Clostridiales bacterium]